MERKEDFAQEALKFLDSAHKLEEEKKFKEAIESYQVAADFLKRSGYMMHRVDDIYTRIEALNNFIKEEKIFQHIQSSAQLDKLQDQAFSLLDGASRLETSGLIEDAIQQYKSAIELLVQAGWSETQLQNLKMKIVTLLDRYEHQKVSQQQLATPVEIQPQIVSAFGEKKDVAKTEELQRYRERKRREEQIQNDAFAFIDNAKFLERDRKYDDAINNYEQAIVLLNSIGWDEQTKNIQIIVQKLRNDKEEFEKFKLQQQREKLEERFEILPPLTKPLSADSGDNIDIIEFETVQKDEEKIQTEAFNLIDIGKKLEIEKKYDKAISKFENAISLLRSIGWDSYIQPVSNFIKDIKEKQKRNEEVTVLAKKRDIETKTIQETIFMKERDEIAQSAQEIEVKRKKYAQKRRKELEKESQFITILDKADKILHENRDYSGAISEYQKAIGLILGLGSGWQPYINTIKSTISSVKRLKESQVENKLEMQKKAVKRKQQDLEYQQQLSIQLQRERANLQKKEIEFQIRKDEIDYREQHKEEAFKILEDAQAFIKQGDLDNAILAYQNAGNLLAGIQWEDGLPLIENAIFEMERRKKDLALIKQKDLQKSIKSFNAEKEFQEKIAREMRLEREKLKQKEIRLKERKKELKFREERKQLAFKILEEAQTHLKQGNFDKTIEIYHKATNIFAEIQWYEEVELIGKAIIEIENNRRDLGLKKQKELQILLKKEQEERDFQEKVAHEMKVHKERLEQRNIELKEIENETAIRETRKEEAFKLIENAQHFLSLGKFEESIKIYRNVASIFAQIQWTDEIPLIQQAIREVEAKKKEKGLWKQKTMMETIEKEATSRKFLEHIKRQREIERLKIQSEKELIERKKAMTAENIAKQESAFKIIDEADFLLKEESLEEAIEEYQKALRLLNEIGWTGGYIILIEDTIQEIIIKKQEKQKRLQHEREVSSKRIEEEKIFERRISEQIRRQQERLLAKKIEIQKKTDLLKHMESLKSSAFELIDKAEILLNQGLYEQSIELYFQAVLILSEIQFPTEPIKEMIQKVQEKKREEDLNKQYEIELILKRQEEETLFQEKVAENMRIEREKMKNKQIQLIEREELKEYMEKRKQDAFDLLEEAEIFMKQANYDKALEYYLSAELVLNEIQFPTISIRELIAKVGEKKREQELQKQKELEAKLQKEREELKFQKKVAENLIREKQSLKVKQTKIEKIEQVRKNLENKKEEAFNILDIAEKNIEKLDYDQAIINYRKAMLMLNEIQFPTDTINDMIIKASNLKKQQVIEEELKLTRELEKLEEEKKLEIILKERKRQERERQVARQLALQEKERLVQEQMTHREAAFSLLDQARKYLKGIYSDYDSAISLYIQAKDLLEEKIGWEPEINNLNMIIKDLIEEKTKLIEKKKLDEQLRIKRQREYQFFQKEIQERREEHEKQKREQQRKLRELYETKQYTRQTKEEGLSLIDKGKQFAAYHDFENAYKSFNIAIEKFKEIGWIEQTMYIQKEIENTKNLQLKVVKEELSVQKIYEDLRQKKLEEELVLKEKDKEIKETVVEVGDLTGEIAKLIEERKELLNLRAQQEKDRIKQDAKEFSKKMGDMIKIKQELIDELDKSQEVADKQKEDLIKAEDKKKADEIKKMLRDVSKKKKN